MLGGVDRWLSGLASHSSAQAVITQTLRDAGDDLPAVPVGRSRLPPMWVRDVVVARVACWVPWIAGCLVRLAAQVPNPSRSALRDKNLSLDVLKTLCHFSFLGHIDAPQGSLM